MIRTERVEAILIPEEVEAFAAEQGVSAELPAVIEMTRRVFPGTHLSVQVEDDPEIANDRHIVIIASRVDLSVEQALDATYEWHKGVFACCPAPLVCVFRLGLELAP